MSFGFWVLSRERRRGGDSFQENIQYSTRMSNVQVRGQGRDGGRRDHRRYRYRYRNREFSENIQYPTSMSNVQVRGRGTRTRTKEGRGDRGEGIGLPQRTQRSRREGRGKVLSFGFWVLSWERRRGKGIRVRVLKRISNIQHQCSNSRTRTKEGKGDRI